MSPSPGPADATVPGGRIPASIDAWKRKLLDLTKRNRALHFRPNRVSTLEIVDEPPGEVFRLLCLQERSLRFKAALDEAPTGAAASPPGGDVLGDGFGDGGGDAGADEESVQPDFAPYDAAAPDAAHTDEWLKTDATPDHLDRALRRLDEIARTSIDEQGVNTLFLALGMLHYVEDPRSDQVLRAPLVLLPVELSRKSARSGYLVRAGDDDPMVNPALVESLRRTHGVTLPELPDSAAIPEDYDLREFFRAVATSIAGKERWSLKSTVYLSPLSFQKFAMYKDLEANTAALSGHRLIRQLVLRAGDEGTDAVVGLPAEIREMDLDRDYAPESTAQVVDADSSQLRAIAAAARDHDLVIEGPPGTGKSQTITNLIAQALSAGKRVLFVAEKMAALSVVHDRLVRAGLGEFCLEVHSTKANKRLVMKELASALDASLQGVARPAPSTQRLPEVRKTLAEYADAVHAPWGSLDVSPWHGYGQVGLVLDAPRIPYSGPVEGSVTREDLERARRGVRDLAAASAGIGVPALHPWRGTSRTFYSAADLEAVEDAGAAVLRAIDVVTGRSRAVEAALGLPAAGHFADVDATLAIGQVLAQSPGAPLSVLESATWNAPPPEAVAVLDRGRALVALEARVLQCVADDALELDHGEDAAYVERKSSGVLGLFALLAGRYRTVRRRWMAWRRPSYDVSMAEQAQTMRLVDRIRVERRELDAMTLRGRELFGDLWQGRRSDWGALGAYVEWVVAFRQRCVRNGLTRQAMSVASRPRPDVALVLDLGAAAEGARGALARLRELVGWPETELAAEEFPAIVERVRALVTRLQDGPGWAAFEAARSAVAGSLARDVLPPAMEGSLAFADAEASFLRAFWMRWLSAVVHARPPLERFHTLTHEQRVLEFRDLDRQVLQENRARLVGELRARVQETLRRPELATAMQHLRREMARQRGLSPLRRTMHLAGPVIRAIKPCLMMSPLTVAQLLEGSEPAFDVAIFDEASQLPPEDAVGAILRARRLVVVGDPKQLPPTNFFSVSIGTVDAPLDEDGSPLCEDSESILEEFLGAGFPHSRLRWHYRSAHESLIRFSNTQFYDSDLFTFPSVERESETLGLQFEFVEGGLYEGKGLNLAEARRVADAVVEFARDQLARRAAGEAPLTLGVGTFNLRQQIAIQDELENRRRDDPTLDPFFDRGADEPFFVKNLENIQGDERDVIFLSVTYARAEDGRLRYNFGPLNGENGWRRLNVLATRARRRMRVFSSMRADEIDPAATTSRGALLLREFLHFAERGRLEGTTASALSETESPFERDVLRALVDRGITAVPQVGVSGYRIDLGVVDEGAPGRFVCGIECDGVAYHASETARDRDRLRQQVLEARGWTIHRVWSTDWFKDRKGQIDRLVGLIDVARRREEDLAAAELRARERAAAEGTRRAAEDANPSRAAPPPAGQVSETEYARPVAAPYVMAPGSGRHAGTDLLSAPEGRIVQAVVAVVEAEGPIHLAELTTRVAGMWSARAGSRIQGRIHEACASAVRDGRIERRGMFLWNRGGTCVVRSRAGTRISADRIPPEEYEMAVLAVLADGHGFTRSQLTNEVRAVLGFGRTGAALDEVIGSVVDRLLAAGRVGEGSTGIRLRR